jgi:hypothetical protein
MVPFFTDLFLWSLIFILYLKEAKSIIIPPASAPMEALGQKV